ncbi:MAG: aldehyde dehydrogenase family protein [Polaromonas sp.]|nr:aldehyde dehydrogenase family protein [Polaromonas sp.]
MTAALATYPVRYINGQWVKARSSETLPVYDFNTEALVATVPSGMVPEAKAAVLAARTAFDSWSTPPLETRAGHLGTIAAGIEGRSEKLKLTISREVGMPFKIARAVQVGGPAWHWCNFAKVARAFEWEKKVSSLLMLRDPIGVVGCITPLNFLFSQITLKITRALVAGCTVSVRQRAGKRYLRIRRISRIQGDKFQLPAT